MSAREPSGRRAADAHDADGGESERTRCDLDPPARGAPGESIREAAPPFPGSDILGSGSSREVLERLMAGDPLGVWEACEEHLQVRCLLFDLGRVTQQAMARMAYRARTYAGDPPLHLWMTACIEDAAQDLMERDREEERKGIPPTEPWDQRYGFVAEVLGVPVGLARRVCITLNELDDDVRHAFFHVVARDKSIRSYVAEGHGPPDRVRELLGRAFRQISRSAPSELDGSDPAHAAGDVEGDRYDLGLDDWKRGS